MKFVIVDVIRTFAIQEVFFSFYDILNIYLIEIYIDIPYIFRFFYSTFDLPVLFSPYVICISFLDRTLCN